MAFTRPTLQDLITRVEGDLRSGLGIITLLRRSFLSVIARVQAGLSHLLLGYLAFVEKQAFPDTAEDAYLIRWAGIYGVKQKNATYEQIVLTATGTVGVTIPQGRVYRRTDGVEYTVDADVTFASTTALVPITASLAGETGRMIVADQIALLSPIAGVTSAAVVTTIVVEAEDLETIDSLRSRLIDRIQNPPAGGAATDYVQWARAVAGVTRAWVGPQALGPGTVVVYIVNDNNNPITPTTALINAVAAYIETLRPVTANISVVSPTLLPINMTIAIKPNTAAVQAAIMTELKDLIYRDSALAGSYKAPGVLNTGKILVSRINEAISIALGEDDHQLILVNGSTPADIVPTTGQLTVLGTITWQTLT